MFFGCVRETSNQLEYFQKNTRHFFLNLNFKHRNNKPHQNFNQKKAHEQIDF